MASVYTDLGPGEVTETKTVRGRTSYRVAGHDGSFDMWFDGTKLGFADVDTDNSVNLPYNPTPQYGVGALTDSTIQPIHEIDPDKRLHPADSQTFDPAGESEAGSEPGPAAHLFAAGISIPIGGGGGAQPFGYPSHHGTEADPEDAYPPGHPAHDYYDDDGGDALGQAMQSEQEWHPSDQYGDLNQPYPADTWRSSDAEQNRFGSVHEADVLEGAPTRFEPNFIVNDTDDEFLHNQDVEEDERESTAPDGIVHFTGSNHPMHRNAWAAAIPIAEAVAPSLARGVGMGMAEDALGGDDQNPQGGQDGPPSGMDAVNDAAGHFDENHPLPIPGLSGTGWGDLATKHGHNLGDRYADIIAAYDPNDRIAQFRHDPEAFINRVGHVESEGLSPRFAQYGELVEADEILRTAAWKDVREKAVRLRREGRVHVKDVADDRIYASVQGDHGTYDVMIKKGGAFAGFGGGHAVSNWHCGCEWGKWAFQRRFTMIGRLCSHGLASYHEMQSQHLKGQKQKRKRVNPRNARVASDQTESDWTVDGNVPTSELNKLRNWAETDHDTWNGSQADHVDDVQDAVEKAREEGVDADQLVASLQLHAAGYFKEAAPGDNQLTNDLGSLIGQPGAVPTPRPTPSAPGAAEISGTGTENDAARGFLNGSPFSSAGDPKIDTPTQTPAAGPLNPSGVLGTPGSTPGASGAGGKSDWFGTGGGSSGSGAQPAAGGVGGSAGDAQSSSGHDARGGAGSTPGVGDAADSRQGDSIGQGDYKINSGDTLADIAQRAGYGGDYNSLAQQNNIADPNKINAGDSIKIGDPKAPGAAATPGAGGGNGGAASNPATPAPDQTPGAGQQPGADAINSPANTNPGLNNPAAPAAADLGAVSGAGTGGGGDTTATGTPKVDLQAVGGGGTGSPTQSSTSDMTSDVGTPKDSSTGAPSTGASGSGGSNALSGVTDAISNAGGIAGGVADAVKSFTGSMNLEADRDWFEAAYPDAKFQDHKPFNGSGGIQVTEWGTSKDNVKDNYSYNLEDVTEEPNKSYLKETEPLKDLREGRVAAVGIARAGNGPQRAPVQPVVVRERKPRNGAAVVASEQEPDDFDPLAPRTAASFDDPYADQEADSRAVLAAANMGTNDIVAQFHASGGAAALEASAPTQTDQYDDISSSPAFRQAMQRTAGRNYSLAEQDALIREGDKGGAGNLNSLDLSNTHYEAMNSVGLW